MVILLIQLSLTQNYGQLSLDRGYSLSVFYLVRWWTPGREVQKCREIIERTYGTSGEGTTFGIKLIRINHTKFLGQLATFIFNNWKRELIRFACKTVIFIKVTIYKEILQQNDARISRDEMWKATNSLRSIHDGSPLNHTIEQYISHYVVEIQMLDLLLDSVQLYKLVWNQPDGKTKYTNYCEKLVMKNIMISNWILTFDQSNYAKKSHREWFWHGS